MSSNLIELRVWRQFVTLADELHFGRAAVRLHMTQPPLTQAIAQLERGLGVRLFDRTKRSVQLTPAGTALLPQALDLLERAAALPEQAGAAARGELGRLRLGFVSTVGFDLLPGWVRTFREHHPRVRLDLIEATGDLQLEALAQGQIDAGFMLHSPGFAPAGLERCLIAQEALVLALPEQHPLATQARLSLAWVLAEPLVIFPRRIVPSLFDAIVGLYHAHGQVPDVAQEAIQMQTIVNLVSAGLGLAWVPESVTQFRRPGVVYRRVSTPRARAGQLAVQPGLPQCETSLVWPVGRPNPVLQRFITHLGLGRVAPAGVRLAAAPAGDPDHPG
jgi:DNA-binding transcriptional LysR family regulator